MTRSPFHRLPEVSARGRRTRQRACASRRAARGPLVCIALALWLVIEAVVAQNTHVLSRGRESLWLVAATHDVPIWKLLNRIPRQDVNLNALPEGMAVPLPPGVSPRPVPSPEAVARRQAKRVAELRETRQHAVYLLGLGETLWDVSLKYDVKLAPLMRKNDLDDADLNALRFETPIAVPGRAQAEITQPGATPPDARVHRLDADETVFDLAGAYQTGVAEILAINRMSVADARALAAGTRVFIPTSSRTWSQTESKLRRAYRAEAERLGLGSSRTASRLYRGRTRAAWVRAAGPARALTGTLQWPVAEGHFVRGYGSGAGEYHLALDIAAEIGAKVRAAAPGMVAYADDTIDGYGKMVFVVHPGGWITMYAHNSALHVEPGERVATGDVIAEVGSTGLSRGPHVHFELLYRGKNCDPAPLLRPGIRHRDGDVHPPEPEVSWKPDTPRPDQVRCARRRHHPGTDEAS